MKLSPLLGPLFMTLAAIVLPVTAEAFWFLPGFGGGRLDAARAAAVDSEQLASTSISTDPMKPVPFTEDMLTQPIGDIERTDSLAHQLEPEIEEEIKSQQEPQTELVTLFQEAGNSPSPQDIPQRALNLTAPEAPQSLQNLQDAAFSPTQTASTLSAMEMDRILPSGVFDTTYDISDGLAQKALSTFPMITFIEVRNGDTLSSILQSAGISHQETIQAARSLGDVFNLGSLRPGQIIELELDGAIAPFEVSRLRRISIAPTNLEVVHVRRKPEGFNATINKVELIKVLIHAKGTLTSGSIYVDGGAMDIEGSVIANYVNALDAQINFSRIQSGGDEIEMVYEAFFNQAGKLIDAGNVLYARYGDRGGQTYEAVRFKNRDKISYYTRDARFTGQVNTLMLKPLGGGRITSRFGWRIHPVYGDRRMHNGVDYGASCGTPIYAAGNGVLTFVGWKSSYGKFIGIKHGSIYSTNYAHLKSFANGMRPGVRVKKGQLIGRVGTTGVSTGCHLHFEVVKNGRKINPLADHIPRGDDLAAATRQRFRAFLAQMDEVREQGTTLQTAMARAAQGEF